MINKAARDDMVTAGMPSEQADAVATHIPDWSQFATKADIDRQTWRIVIAVGLPIYIPLYGLAIAFLVDYFLR